MNCAGPTWCDRATYSRSKPRLSIYGRRARDPTMVSFACERLVRRDLVDAREILACKIDIDRADIFLQIFAPFCAGDRNDVVALCQYPGECQLRGRALFFARDFFHALYQVEIALKIFSLKSRRRAPVIVFRQVLRGFNLPGQKSATERAVWHKPNTKLTAHAEHFCFRIARPE